ncbi:hypothetical protein [Cognatishimia sp. F0-27]|uniref:hypothetical protein n=1 Tax=Cognatishimia sp. F0-27 TaxID=2816855 RepID=UPI001D0C18FE|nr:hypothetical protein [Cognatishimia sp. F0-27]MCC1493486.1 hypothetical protein [Cognatishimia sp. F0-27]
MQSPRAQEIFVALEEVQGEVAGLRAAPRGHPHPHQHRFWPPSDHFDPEILCHYPRLPLELTAIDRVVDLASENLDETLPDTIFAAVRIASVCSHCSIDGRCPQRSEERASWVGNRRVISFGNTAVCVPPASGGRLRFAHFSMFVASAFIQAEIATDDFPFDVGCSCTCPADAAIWPIQLSWDRCASGWHLNDKRSRKDVAARGGARAR